MALHFNGDRAMGRLKIEAATRLQRAAVFFQTEQMNRLNKPNPRPHKTPSLPGEYPRKRTGAGQAGVALSSLSIDGIIQDGLRVRVGQMRNSWYMLVLEMQRDRLGYRRTLADLRARVAAILRVKGGPTVGTTGS